jgi:hypothetical protein
MAKKKSVKNSDRVRAMRERKVKTVRARKEKSVKRAASATLNKTDLMLDAIRRPNGATLHELMNIVGWQAHSVRGFVTTVKKKQGLPIRSFKNDLGLRAYALA